MRNIKLSEGGSEKLYKILLAEDDEDEFYIFNHAISSLIEAVQILRTCNGVMLSSMIQTTIHPDVIFLDINMPYKSGISCLKEIRTNPAFDKTSVVIYSAVHQKREIDVCYTLGANFYLVKPIQFALTKIQLKDLFQNEHFKQNLQAPPDQFVMNYQDLEVH